MFPSTLKRLQTIGGYKMGLLNTKPFPFLTSDEQWVRIPLIVESAGQEPWTV